MNKIELSTFQCNMCGGLGDTFLAMLLLIYRHLPFLNDELTITFIHDNKKHDFLYFKKLFLLNFPSNWTIINRFLNTIRKDLHHQNFRVYEKIKELNFEPFFTDEIKTFTQKRKTVCFKIYVRDIHTTEQINLKCLDYKSINSEQYEKILNLFSKYEDKIDFIEFHDWYKDKRSLNQNIILEDPIEVSNNNLKLIYNSNLVICCEGFFSIASNVFKKETVVYCENEGLGLLKNDNQYFCLNFNIFLKEIENQLCSLINK